MEFIPNQPVYFSPESCGCALDYVQPVNRSDRTSFLLPNPCRGTWTDNGLSSTFADAPDLATWSQGTGNGFTNAWTFNVGTGKVRTVGDSKILNKAHDISAYRKYRVNIDLTICDGVTIYIVGYKSYSSDASDDYDILAISTASGAQVISFNTFKDYVRLGFYVDGLCEGEGDFNILDDFALEIYEYGGCVSLCLKDKNGNSVADLTSFATPIEGYIVVDFPWSEFDLDDGCYSICICSNLLGENLFIDGDKGTFEDNIDNIGGIASGAQSTTFYVGAFSYNVTSDTGFPPQTILQGNTQITLKPNTHYKGNAFIYVDKTPGSPGIKRIALKFNTPTTITETTGDIDPDVDGQVWKELTIDFTTGSTADERQGYLQIVSMGGAAVSSGTQVYIDNIQLVEVTDMCSQGFSLAESWECNTLYLEYTNSDEAFGFIYPPDFFFRTRLKGVLTRPEYPEEYNAFEYADGTRAVQYGASRKVSLMSIEAIPEELHDALRLAVLHDTLKIDGKDYIKEAQADYQPRWKRGVKTAPVEIKVAEKTQLYKNTSC